PLMSKAELDSTDENYSSLLNTSILFDDFDKFLGEPILGLEDDPTIAYTAKERKAAKQTTSPPLSKVKIESPETVQIQDPALDPNRAYSAFESEWSQLSSLPMNQSMSDDINNIFMDLEGDGTKVNSLWSNASLSSADNLDSAGQRFYGM